MKLFVLLLNLIIFTLSATAQNSKIEGKVSDGKTGNSIAGVSVTLNGGKVVAVTNVDGNFVIVTGAAKNYTLTLSSVGYSSKELADVEVVLNKVTELDIVLTPLRGMAGVSIL